MVAGPYYQDHVYFGQATGELAQSLVWGRMDVDWNEEFHFLG